MRFVELVPNCSKTVATQSSIRVWASHMSIPISLALPDRFFSFILGREKGSGEQPIPFCSTDPQSGEQPIPFLFYRSAVFAGR